MLRHSSSCLGKGLLARADENTQSYGSRRCRSLLQCKRHMHPYPLETLTSMHIDGVATWSSMLPTCAVAAAQKPRDDRHARRLPGLPGQCFPHRRQRQRVVHVGVAERVVGRDADVPGVVLLRPHALHQKLGCS